MVKSKKVVKQKLRAVKKDKHAYGLLKVLQATGLFRWERPSTKAEEVINILTHGIGIGVYLITVNINYPQVLSLTKQFLIQP